MSAYLLKSSNGSYWNSQRGWTDKIRATHHTEAEKEARSPAPATAEWVKVRTYNHMFTLAFECVSLDEDAEDITPDQLRAALLRRIIDLDEGEAWLEATGGPDDTYEEDE